MPGCVSGALTNLIDIVTIALLHCSRSEVRLASGEAPPKIQTLNFISGDLHVHQSLQRSCLLVFVHSCRMAALLGPIRISAPSTPARCSGGSLDPPARW